MLEKMKAVSSPLTIIGLFCGIVEVVGLIVMGSGKIAPEAQRELIWLVKWFPVLLVLLFFVTLWFKDRVLYAPGDFKDEKNYLAAMNAKQGLAIDTFQAMLVEAIPEIVNGVTKAVSVNGAEERRKIAEVVQTHLSPVQIIADSAREIHESFANAYRHTFSRLSESDRRKALAIWRFLAAESKPTKLGEIASKLSLDEIDVDVLLHHLTKGGFVKESRGAVSGITYSASSRLLPNENSGVPIEYYRER